MRQVWVTRAGPPEVLAVREAPDPSPGPGEVRIRVAAAGVNFADIMMRLGFYSDAPPLPAVPGYEVAGVVDAVGPGVESPRTGEAVLAFCRFGGYSDTLCVPRQFAYPCPAGTPPTVAAALPVNYLTAYQMLVVMAGVKPGDTVVVHGAAGGVGLAALELCRLHGARVIGSASPGKHAFLRERGVDVCFDSRAPVFADLVRRATGGHGAEIVLEPRAGAWIRESYRALAPTGRLVLFGFSQAAAGKRPSRLAVLRTLAGVPWLALNPIRLLNDNKAVLGVNLGRLWDQQERVAAWLRQLLDWFAAGQLRPRVDRVFPFAEAAQAHHYLQDRRNIGKVLLVPEKPPEGAP